MVAVARRLSPSGSLAEGSRYTDAHDARVLGERRVTRGVEADRD
jgi:hypothetical protein